MVNRNGSNNGHSNGTGIDLVPVNGHKPDAALDATHHELLWDGLPPAVTNALGQLLGVCPTIRSWRRKTPRNILLTALWTLSWSY